MSAFTEGDLHLSFGSSWRVLKYDAESSFYRAQLCTRVDSTKAVDFLCLCENTPLLMLEVKDFSRAVPPRIQFDEVPVVVAQKVRDTLAGIVGGSHKAGGTERAIFQDSFRKLASPPHVIYLFQDLATPTRQIPERTANKRDVIHKKLKANLKWLTSHVLVVGLADYTSAINELTIRKVDEANNNHR